jgi:uncharacterized membrane protein YwaF
MDIVTVSIIVLLSILLIVFLTSVTKLNAFASLFIVSLLDMRCRATTALRLITSSTPSKRLHLKITKKRAVSFSVANPPSKSPAADWADATSTWRST